MIITNFLLIFVIRHSFIAFVKACFFSKENKKVKLKKICSLMRSLLALKEAHRKHFRRLLLPIRDEPHLPDMILERLDLWHSPLMVYWGRKRILIFYTYFAPAILGLQPPTRPAWAGDRAAKGGSSCPRRDG
jgi:hypothetical protein